MANVLKLILKNPRFVTLGGQSDSFWMPHLTSLAITLSDMSFNHSRLARCDSHQTRVTRYSISDFILNSYQGGLVELVIFYTMIFICLHTRFDQPNYVLCERLDLIFKSPRFVPFVDNMTQFKAKLDMIVLSRYVSYPKFYTAQNIIII